jgi:tellurite resistance protein TehA-like permease
MAASGWLALGPIGTGALGLLLLGADAPAVLSANAMGAAGAIAQGIGVIGGAILLGYGVWWLLLAIMTTARYVRGGLNFNLGWWGFTFPLGVYSAAILAFARQTHLGFVAAIGGILVLCLAAIWAIVAFQTMRGAWTRALFVAPCLAGAGVMDADCA